MSLPINLYVVHHLCEPILISFPCLAPALNFRILLFVALYLCSIKLVHASHNFSFTKLLYTTYFLLCFLIKRIPLNKEGNKSCHTPDASFCSRQNNNSNNCYHHSHNKIFFRWPERGKTFSHKKRTFFCLRKQNSFWYVERNKCFSHLQYNFFPLFSPWLSVATAGRSTDRTTKLSEYATNTSSLCGY